MEDIKKIGIELDKLVQDNPEKYEQRLLAHSSYCYDGKELDLGTVEYTIKVWFVQVVDKTNGVILKQYPVKLPAEVQLEKELTFDQSNK